MAQVLAFPSPIGDGYRMKQPKTKQKKLLFLSCDGPNGETKEDVRKKLRRHVQLDYRSKSTASASSTGSPNSSDQTSTPSPPPAPVQIKFRGHYAGSKKTASTRQRTLKTSTVRQQPQEEDDALQIQLYNQPHGFDPFSSLAVSQSAGSDCMQRTHELLTWHLFPLTKAELLAPDLGGYLKGFKRKWWDLAMIDEGFYHALTAYVTRTEESITGSFHAETYYKHRGLALNHLQRSVKTGSHDPVATAATVLTVTLLCDFAIYDSQDAECSSHLKYLQSLASSSFLSSLHETYWFSIVTTSLKHSLWSIDAPRIDYSPNPYCRFEDLLANRADLQYKAKTAALNVLPKLPSVSTGRDLDLAGMFSLFQRMYLDAENMASLNPADYGPSMGLFYDVAHALAERLSEAQCLLQQSTGYIEDATESVFCVLLTGQLSTWALCVHKFHSRCRSTVVGAIQVMNRTVEILKRQQDPIVYWRSCASLETLTWVLFVSCAYTMLRPKASQSQRAYLLPLLGDVLGELQVHSFEDFRSMIKAFPWIHIWSETRVRDVWQMLGRE